MNRVIRVVSQVVILLLLASPALAWNRYGWRRPRVVVAVGVSPWWGPPFAPWGYFPPHVVAFPPPVAVVPPPVVIQPQLPPPPPVYVEREDAPLAPEAQEQVAPGPEETASYWYYCPGAREYYPKVETCSQQWVRVPASAE
jgi:hypothetical protein